jgi:hypothetical protein
LVEKNGNIIIEIPNENQAATNAIKAQANIPLYRYQKTPKNKQGQEKPSNISVGWLFAG